MNRLSSSLFRSSTRVASTRALCITGATVASAMIVACGGAAEREPRAPSMAPRDSAAEPTSIEEAEARIKSARAALDGREYDQKKATDAPGAGATSDSAAPKSEPSTTPAARPAPAPESAPSKAAVDKCGGPCRALSSMRTAVTALCRMAGAEDTRCVEAQKTLADSEKRVSPCTCAP